jgi:hypothetical protein
MGIRWSSIYCSNAKFILNIDDDVIMNTKYLISYLEKNMNGKKSFICNIYRNIIVNRNQSDRSYLTYDEFKPDILLSRQGSAYILTNDITPLLVQNSFNIKKIFFEDAFLGILAQYLNIKFIDIWHRYLPDKGYLYDDLKNLNFCLRIRCF